MIEQLNICLIVLYHTHHFPVKKNMQKRNGPLGRSRKTNWSLWGCLSPQVALAPPLGELAKIFDFCLRGCRKDIRTLPQSPPCIGDSPLKEGAKASI